MSATLDPNTIPGLSNLAARVAKYLEEYTDRRYQDSFLSTERIADALGRSVGRVRAAISELIQRGLIERIRDYSLVVRRRLRLLWRSAAGCRSAERQKVLFPAPASSSANASVAPDVACDSRPISVATNASPQTPLLEEPEGNQKKVSGESAARLEPAPPPPGIVSTSAPAPDRTPEPMADQAAQVAAEASRVLSEPVTPARAASLLRLAPLDWVRAAVAKGAAKVAQGGVATVGYVRAVLIGWQDEGGPPAAAKPAETRQEKIARMAETMARLRKEGKI